MSAVKSDEQTQSALKDTTIHVGSLSWFYAAMQPVDKVILWGLGLKLEAFTFEVT